MDSTNTTEATSTNMDTTATYTTEATDILDHLPSPVESTWAQPTDILDDLATAVMATTATGVTMILDPSANLVAMVDEDRPPASTAVRRQPPFMEPIPVSPPLSRSASQHSLALSPPASPAVRVQPPATPPPAEPLTEPPALRQRRGFRVRTFCADRAGSDTESTASEDEGPSLRTYSLPTALAMEAAVALPVPTTPLTRQVACPMSPAPAAEEDETEDETEDEAGEEADDEATEDEAEEEEQEQEQQQGTPELIVPIPLWLFVTTLVAMVLYLFFIIYLLSSRCDVPIRR